MNDLELAESLARGAGQILLRHYDGGVEVDHKAGREPVTAADRAANDYIVGRLREERPDDDLLAEESIEDGELRGRSRIWLIDPMDGTKEFLDRNGQFSVMVGLAVEGRAALGVVYRPTEKLLYHGGPDHPTRIVRDGEPEPARVSEIDDPADMRLVISRSHRPERVDRMIEKLGIRRVDASGSVGLKVARIVEGRNDLYLHPSSGTRLWDACAPEAILAGAGGRLTDFDGIPPIYEPEDLLNRRGLLASNGRAHDEIVERIRGIF